MASRRTVVVSVRLTAAERDSLKRRAAVARMSPSDYVRARALPPDVPATRLAGHPAPLTASARTPLHVVLGAGTFAAWSDPVTEVPCGE